MQAKKKPVATVDAPAIPNKVSIVGVSLPPAKQAGIKIEDEPAVTGAKLAEWMLNTVKVEVK
jgi:electron transfer flavoprotein beta subunit